jgi:hypothetical protein
MVTKISFTKISGMSLAPPANPLDPGQAAPTTVPSPTNKYSVLPQPRKSRSAGSPKANPRAGRKSLV